MFRTFTKEHASMIHLASFKLGRAIQGVSVYVDDFNSTVTELTEGQHKICMSCSNWNDMVVGLDTLVAAASELREAIKHSDNAADDESE